MRGAWRETCGWTLAAVGLGCLHLIAAGAPAPYPAVNAAAAVIGLVAGHALARGRWQGATVVLAGLAILATALAGPSVGGVARWVAVGPIRLQPGLILVPPLVIALARQGGALPGLGMVLAIGGLALSPDRGTAGALAVALVVVAGLRRDRATIAIAALGCAGFAWTLRLPDPLAPARFVERVFAAASGHRIQIALLAAGTAATIAPGVWRLATGGALRPAVAFVAVWAGLLGAAMLGDYPTPVLGYGASGVLGYVLALIALGGGARAARRVR